MYSTLERSTKISGNEDFVINENSKACITNINVKMKGEKMVPGKDRVERNSNLTSNDSALKSFANNVMSLFGYGSSVSNIGNFLPSNGGGTSNKSKMRQMFSGIPSTTNDKNRNETVALDTDVEEVDVNLGTKELSEIGSTVKSARLASTSRDRKKSGKLAVNGAVSENVSGSNNSVIDRNKGSSMSYLPVVAHINGKPVHAKHLVRNKIIKYQENTSDESVEPFQNSKDHTIVYPGFNHPVLVPSSSAKFSQFMVPVSGHNNQIFYNTPLINQRIIPHVKSAIYKPAYVHNKVELLNADKNSSIGGHVRQSTLYSQENYSGFFVQPGREPFVRSNGAIKEQYSHSSGIGDISNFNYLGFGTPLVTYRNLSHVPNHRLIYKGNYNVNINLTNEFGLTEASQKTRLQSSNDISLDNSENFKDMNVSGSNSGLNLSSINETDTKDTKSRNDSSNVSNDDKDNTKYDALESLDFEASNKLSVNESETKKSDEQNYLRQSIVKTEVGNTNALSLTTTSSDNFSVTSNCNAKEKPSKKISLNKEIKEENSGTDKNSCKGFIPQASPVINYRSTLDYLVTPLVRYRDISSNLKVRTVAPQLSSNDSCKFKGLSYLRSNDIESGGIALDSNSSRNASILPSNEYIETVYTPVALPLLPQGSGSFNSGNCGGTSSSLNQFPMFHLNFPSDGSTVSKNLQKSGKGGPDLGNKDVPSNCSNGGNISAMNDSVSQKMYINGRYGIVKSSLRPNFGNVRFNGVMNNNVMGYKENSNLQEENIYKHNLKKMHVNKMYQLLSDPNQFPTLPKEMSVNQIEFLMRPKASTKNDNVDNSSSGNKKDENKANSNYSKDCKSGKRIEWDSINRGTFCTVYKANYNGEIVAVKCPQRKIHDSDPLMSRYRCYIEWKLLYRCNRHPNILSLIGGIRINEYEIWLVTEYIKTGDLFKLIHGNNSRSKTFRDNVEYKFKIMYQLADSIRFLHSLSPKIVHKDLKSNNILVDENFNIRICDFGDAEELHYNVITCCTAVTWQYAPPEIVGCSDPARPNSNATEKVDVWSMGCIFLEILTKKTPLQHILDNTEDSCKHSTLYNMIHSNRIEHELKIPPLPESLYNLILMCLRPNPEVRASSMEVFDYLVNNENKILKQLGHINQYKIGGVK
ncbi:protein kinase domain [Cryptosporidium ryanae]|uniref:protein kinase domain n=1 Tax=Cryptosporidium ryanae TaxID=515981 RepID=UPI00351A410B|nr:protein kinase domain [Cryptosporidium ryanae]